MLNRQMHSTLVKVKRALTGKKSPRKDKEGNVLDDGTASVNSSKRGGGGFSSDVEGTPTKRKHLYTKLHRKSHDSAPATTTTDHPSSGHIEPSPLGTLVRGPLTRAEGATPEKTESATAGMVFGRSLEECVRDTKAEMAGGSGADGADGTTLASTRPVTDSGLDARLIPALVLRCVQYLYKYGVKEEGLFRVTGRLTQTAALRNQFDTGADYDLLTISPDILNPHSVSSLLKMYLRELPDPVLTRALGPMFNIALDRASQAGVVEDEQVKAKEEREHMMEVIKAEHHVDEQPAASAGDATHDDTTPKAELKEGETTTADREQTPAITLTQPESASKGSDEPIPDGNSYTPPTIAESLGHPPELVQPLSDLVSQLPQENKDLLLTLLDLLAETSSHADENKMPLSNLLLVFCPTLGMNPALLRVLIEHRQAIWDGWMPELSVVGEEDAEHETEIEIQDTHDAPVDVDAQVIHEDDNTKVEAAVLGLGAVVDGGAVHVPRDDEFTIDAGRTSVDAGVGAGGGAGSDYPPARARTGLMMPPAARPLTIRAPDGIIVDSIISSPSSPTSSTSPSSASLASKRGDSQYTDDGVAPGFVIPGTYYGSDEQHQQQHYDGGGGNRNNGIIDGVDVNGLVSSPEKQGLDAPPLSAGLAKAFDAARFAATDPEDHDSGIDVQLEPFTTTKGSLVQPLVTIIHPSPLPPSPAPPSSRTLLPVSIPPTHSSLHPLAPLDDDPSPLTLTSSLSASSFIPISKSNSSTSLSRLSRSAISQFEEVTPASASIAACLIPLPDDDDEDDLEGSQDAGDGDEAPWVFLPSRPKPQGMKESVVIDPPSDPLTASTLTLDPPIATLPLTATTTTTTTTETPNPTPTPTSKSPPTTRRPQHISNTNALATQAHLVLAFRCIIALTLVVTLSGMYQMYLPRYVRAPSPACGVFVFGRGGCGMGGSS